MAESYRTVKVSRNRPTVKAKVSLMYTNRSEGPNLAKVVEVSESFQIGNSSHQGQSVNNSHAFRSHLSQRRCIHTASPTSANGARWAQATPMAPTKPEVRGHARIEAAQS